MGATGGLPRLDQIKSGLFLLYKAEILYWELQSPCAPRGGETRPMLVAGGSWVTKGCSQELFQYSIANVTIYW